MSLILHVSLRSPKHDTFKYITTNLQKPFTALLIKTPLVKRLQFFRLNQETIRATFKTVGQLAFLFICSFWWWVCSQHCQLWLWCRSLSRGLLASHWFVEEGRRSSCLAIGCEHLQNGKGRSSGSAAESRQWFSGSGTSWQSVHCAPASAETGCLGGPCRRCCWHECDNVCVWKDHNIINIS